MDYLGAGYREWRGRIVELYFPARPAGWRPTDPAPLVARTRDAAVLALAEATIGGGRTPDQEEFLVMMLKIVTALRAAREIDGYAKAGLLERLGSRNALAGLSTPLAPDAVVIDLHATPRPLVPAATTAAGVLLIALFVILRSKRRAAAAIPLPAAPEEGPNAPQAPLLQPAAGVAPPGGDATLGRDAALPFASRLRVMLLNLPPQAGREAIEEAPPLGSRDATIAALARAVPGLRFDASGRASIGRADFLLDVDIGLADPVHTAVLDARGDAALPMVRRVLDCTGWRAFAARTGAFISADRLGEPEARAADHTAA